MLLAGCHTLGTQSGDMGPLSDLPRSLPTTKLLTPSHDRDWSPDLAVLPYADISGDQVAVPGRAIGARGFRGGEDPDVAVLEAGSRLPVTSMLDARTSESCRQLPVRDG